MSAHRIKYKSFASEEFLKFLSVKNYDRINKLSYKTLPSNRSQKRIDIKIREEERREEDYLQK